MRLTFRVRLTLWFLLIFALLYVALIAAEMLVFAQTVKADDSVSNDFVREMMRLLLVSLPLGLAAAGIAGYVLAGRVTAPLRRMTETTSHVGPESLNRRVNVETGSPEVADLQRELNEALRRIEHGYRAQARFVGNVSHELRSPIAVMMSQAQILQRRADAGVEDYREFADGVVYEMRQLGRMIESFLMLTRADHAQRIERARETNFFDIILDAVEHNLPLAEIHRVTLSPSFAEMDRDCSVGGDPELLRIMLDNLIRNAVRNSPRGRAVEISVQCTDDDLVTTVRDHGAGISDQSMNHLFDRFFHAPSGATRTQGTGIGLAIVKSVVDLHGGDIRAFNHDEGGAVFELKLPLWDGSEDEAPSADEQTPRGEKPKHRDN